MIGIGTYLILLSFLWIPISCQNEPVFDESLFAASQQALAVGDYSLAESLLRQTLKSAREAGISDARVASTLFHLGELYRNQGQFEKAELYFWRALPVWAKNLGPVHPEMARGLMSLSLVYEAKEEYQKALPLIKQALKINESVFGQDHPNLLPPLKQFTNLLTKMNRQREAMTLRDRIQAIRSHHMDTSEHRNFSVN